MLNLFIFARFEELRASQGITKKKIADALNRKPTICQDWKAGKSTPGDDQIAIIAKILHTTPAYLTGESDEKSPPQGDGLSVRAREAAVLFDRAEPWMQEQVLSLLRAAELSRATPGDAPKGK